MSKVGTTENPLRVAIVGAGPAGFYTAEHLYKQKELTIQVDMFDRLPTPFGLVRNGVAPDHQKIKSVTNVFERIAQKPGFRFFGYVELGRDLSVEDLLAHYHQVVYTTGAQTDRPLNIPGDDLEGSYPATEFVAWYNGHPDYRDYHFDLSRERVAVVGVGNVAIDVARILCRTPEELLKTDIADHALEALRHSKVKEVYVLGRRGPAQAAFTTPEIKEMGELADADVWAPPEEVTLDPLSEQAMAESSDRGVARKVEILQAYAQNQPTGKSRKLIFRFLVSPVELYDDGHGRIKAMRLVHNELYKTDAGSLRPRATDRYEMLPVDIVFRSIGYRGVPLPGVPFHDSWGVIRNAEGRIVDSATGAALIGQYTAGWIKRGPSGVIGTNKPDALETVEKMLADLAAGRINHPAQPAPEALEALVRARQPNYCSYQDWQRLDALEVAAGKACGRPRVKLASIDEIMAALDKPPVGDAAAAELAAA
jgi:ferredoxin/flavodoxin---NADP+ reductase